MGLRAYWKRFRHALRVVRLRRAYEVARQQANTEADALVRLLASEFKTPPDHESVLRRIVQRLEKAEPVIRLVSSVYYLSLSDKFRFAVLSHSISASDPNDLGICGTLLTSAALFLLRSGRSELDGAIAAELADAATLLCPNHPVGWMILSDLARAGMRLRWDQRDHAREGLLHCWNYLISAACPPDLQESILGCLQALADSAGISHLLRALKSLRADNAKAAIAKQQLIATSDREPSNRELANFIFGSEPAIHDAISRNDVEEVRKILASEPGSVGVRGRFRTTPLHKAARYDCREIVNLLIHAGADVNAHANHGATPLHHVVPYDKPLMVDLLCQHGASVNAKDDEGCTPLHEAAGSGHRAVADVLLWKGADVHARDNLGRTPLHCAAFGDRAEFAEALIGAGADINARSGDGSVALQVAIERKSDAVVTLLTPIVE